MDASETTAVLAELESIRAFGRRVSRSHPTIIQAIEEGRIKSVKRDPVSGRVRGIYWRAALVEYSNNTDPTQAERTGAAPLNVRSASFVNESADSPDEHAISESAAAAGVLADAPAQAGEIQARAADAQNTHPAPAPADVSESAIDSGQQESRPAAPGPSGGGDLFQSSKQKEDPHGYLEHRARTEQFKSKQAELEYLRDLGHLVSAADSREANFRRYRTLRDKLLNIPDRVATIVAAERDPARVHQQLTDEIKRVLSELSIDATEAAGGAAERVAA